MKNLKNKKGITLVEVIVVLIIMAILAAILVGAYTGYIDRARDQSERLEARSVLLAITTLYNEDYANKLVGPDIDPTDAVSTQDGKKTYTFIDSINALTGLGTAASNITGINIEDGTVTAFSYKAASGNTWTYANTGTTETFTKVTT